MQRKAVKPSLVRVPDSSQQAVITFQRDCRRRQGAGCSAAWGACLIVPSTIPTAMTSAYFFCDFT